MPVHAIQQAYLDAQGEVERLCAVYDEQVVPLNQQVDGGDISDDAWAFACGDLEDAIGLTAARQARDQARQALVAWGLVQVKALWPIYGCLFPACSLEMLEELFTRREAERRLLPVILKLREWA